MDGDSSTLTLEAGSPPGMIRPVNGKASTPRQLNVKRTGIVIRPNNGRVVIRPFEPASENRIERILGRVAALSEAEVDLLLEDVLLEFRNRHQKTRQFFLRRFEQIKSHLLTDQPLSENRKLLMGAYFTPGILPGVRGPFQSVDDLASRSVRLASRIGRFILSLRATGEGHISSITFRGGVIDGRNQIHIDEPTRFVTAPSWSPTPCSRSGSSRKLIELGVDSPFAEQVLTTLGDQFTHDDIQASISRSLQQNRPRHRELEPVAQNMLTLVQSNYEIFFSPELNLSERIIFPSSPTEINGIEDARFVEFHDDDGSVRYYATYTAFDGKVILPQILETEDFLRFKASTLNGPEVRNKGLALFPRRINGLYAMLSRQDNENIYLMYSDMLHFWYTKEQIAKPTYGWEFVQLGNCGSPLETEAGWLVLTHGVGPMRKYAMGAFLLDLHDPSRLIGRLEEPLLEPNANEREGYVPNVVYSCGGVIHNGELIIPYAMSDYASTFATIPVDTILGAMVRG